MERQMKKSIYLFNSWFEFSISAAGFVIAWLVANFAFTQDEAKVQYNRELNEQKTVLRKQMDELEQKAAKLATQPQTETVEQQNAEAVEQQSPAAETPENASNQTVQKKQKEAEVDPAAVKTAEEEKFYLETKDKNGEIIKKELSREEAERILETSEECTWIRVPVSETQVNIAVLIVWITILSNIIGLYRANRGRYIVNTLLLPVKLILAPLYFILIFGGAFFSIFSFLNVLALPGAKNAKERNEQIRNGALAGGLSALCYYLAKRSVKPADERE